MKKVIDGKRYDTDTAQLLAEWETPDEYPGDLHYVCERLYRKRTGEYFIHGQGGASTRYARSTGPGSWGSGELIDPMPEEKARKWAEEHLGGDEVEAIFEIPEEPTQIRVDGATYAKIKAESARTGESLGAVVARAAESL